MLHSGSSRVSSCPQNLPPEQRITRFEMNPAVACNMPTTPQLIVGKPQVKSRSDRYHGPRFIKWFSRGAAPRPSAGTISVPKSMKLIGITAKGSGMSDCTKAMNDGISGICNARISATNSVMLSNTVRPSSMALTTDRAEPRHESGPERFFGPRTLPPLSLDPQSTLSVVTWSVAVFDLSKWNKLGGHVVEEVRRGGSRTLTKVIVPLFSAAS